MGYPHRCIPYGTVLPTVRDHFSRSISNDTSAMYRTGFQRTPYGMFFLRLSHDVLANFSAVLQHEIVLTCTYVTLVTLSFLFGVPHALYQPVHTHTVQDFQPIFKTVRYFCSCFLHTVWAKKPLKAKFSTKNKPLSL